MASARPRTIGRAAREAGVNVETIRYYERLGLIARPRTAGGYRVYPEDTMRRLQFIRNAQKLGFSLKEIAELAGMTSTGATCEELCARMDEKLSEIDRRIQQLTALRNELASMVDASPRRGPGSNCKVCQSFEVSGC
ncbi:MAG: DNA-binding transcriptional activator of copper-responsive regulon s [Acidobacteriota bacterium]